MTKTEMFVRVKGTIINDMNDEDRLKELKDVCLPDIRNQYFNFTLEDIHYVLERINLNRSAPENVQTQFETAKNLALYSWFVYRFHQISEMAAYTAMEMGLREKYSQEEPEIDAKKLTRMTMKPLLDEAKKRKWLENDKFPSLYARAKYAAQIEKAREQEKTHDFDSMPSMPIEEPTEAEITEVMKSFDLASVVLDNTYKLRNSLAHDLTKMAPDSLGTLSLVSEVINQLYE